MLEGGGSGKISVMGRAREIELEPRMRTTKLKDLLGANFAMKEKMILTFCWAQELRLLNFFV